MSAQVILSRGPVPTNNFLVRAILPSANIDKVEHGLRSSKSSDEVLKVFDILGCAGFDQHIAQATDIGIDSTDDTGVEWHILVHALDPVAHGCVEMRGSTAAARFSVPNIIVMELAKLVSS